MCAQAPTDWGKPGFILNSDSVVFFKQRTPTISRARSCSPISSCRRISRRCSIRPRARFPRGSTSISKGFNPCQQLSQKDLQASIAGGTLVRSMAHNMTVLQKYRGAMMDVITSFVNNPKMTPRSRQRDGGRRRRAEVSAPRPVVRGLGRGRFCRAVTHALSQRQSANQASGAPGLARKAGQPGRRSW